MNLVWCSIILTQILFFSVENPNGLWAKVIKQALKTYAGHRQQHRLAADSENGFSNHILLKQEMSLHERQNMHLC